MSEEAEEKVKPTDRSELLDKAKKSNEAVQCGKFRAAIDMYTEAIALDLTNHVLISNRSAAFIHVKEYQESLNDAKRVIELKPAWPKGYYRKGVALQYLEKYEEAIVALAKGLSLDSSSAQMLAALIDAALTSTIGGKSVCLYVVCLFVLALWVRAVDSLVGI
jgi:tetratricopeptide (TPR) repeat protein